MNSLVTTFLFNLVLHILLLQVQTTGSICVKNVVYFRGEIY
jgi:hypothetical protein